VTLKRQTHFATAYRDEAKVQRPTADLTPRRLTFVPIRRLLALTVVALGGITMTVAGGVKVAHSGAPTSFLLLATGIFLVVLSLVGFATRANWRRWSTFECLSSPQRGHHDSPPDRPGSVADRSSIHRSSRMNEACAALADS
jgi:hypothetical protein